MSFPRKMFSVRVIDLCCDAPPGMTVLHMFYCSNFDRSANTNSSSFTPVNVLVKVISMSFIESASSERKNMTSLTEGFPDYAPVI